jgi:hypothetical protein
MPTETGVEVRKSKRRQRTFYQSDHDEDVFLRKRGKKKIVWKWRMWIRGLGLVATYYGWSRIEHGYFDIPHGHFIDRLGSTGEMLGKKV